MMNNKIISLVFFILVFKAPVLSQSAVEGGLKFGHYFNNRFQVQEVINGILVRSTPAGRYGFRAGAFLEHQVAKKVVLAGEVAFSLDRGGTTGPVIQILTDRWLNSLSPNFHTLELNSTARFKFNRFLEPIIGLGVNRILYYYKLKHTVQDEDVEDEDLREHNIQFNNENGLIVSIEDSYEKFTILGSFGIRLIHGRLIMDAIYERSVTPLSRTLSFRGGSHPFVQRMDRISISLGYKLFQSKKKLTYPVEQERSVN